MQCVKRRENRGGEAWSCLYTQMRLLESGWLEIGHDQFHHLGGGGGGGVGAAAAAGRVFIHIQSRARLYIVKVVSSGKLGI